MEHHERVDINALPHNETCFCFELELKLGAHTHDRSRPWPGFEPRISFLRAQHSATLLSHYP